MKIIQRKKNRIIFAIKKSLQYLHSISKSKKVFIVKIQNCMQFQLQQGVDERVIRKSFPRRSWFDCRNFCNNFSMCRNSVQFSCLYRFTLHKSPLYIFTFLLCLQPTSSCPIFPLSLYVQNPSMHITLFVTSKAISLFLFSEWRRERENFHKRLSTAVIVLLNSLPILLAGTVLCLLKLSSTLKQLKFSRSLGCKLTQTAHITV